MVEFLIVPSSSFPMIKKRKNSLNFSDPWFQNTTPISMKKHSRGKSGKLTRKFKSNGILRFTANMPEFWMNKTDLSPGRNLKKNGINSSMKLWKNPNSKNLQQKKKNLSWGILTLFVTILFWLMSTRTTIWMKLPKNANQKNTKNSWISFSVGPTWMRIRKYRNSMKDLTKAKLESFSSKNPLRNSLTISSLRKLITLQKGRKISQ